MRLNRVDFARYCLSLHVARTDAASKHAYGEGVPCLLVSELGHDVVMACVEREQRAYMRVKRAEDELSKLGV